MAGNQFHSEKINIILRAEFKNSFDVGVVELGERQSFLAELFSCSFVSDRAAGQHLHCNVTVELFVMGAVNFTHPARADLLNDSIMAERPANHGQGIASFVES